MPIISWMAPMGWPVEWPFWALAPMLPPRLRLRPILRSARRSRRAQPAGSYALTGRPRGSFWAMRARLRSVFWPAHWDISERCAAFGGGAFPLTVFAPFILDASITLGRRVLRGEKFWQAHREHYYQRMIRMSKGHAITVRIWYVVMLLGAGFALAGLRIGIQAQWIIFGLWSGALLMCGWEVDRRWHVWTRLNRL